MVIAVLQLVALVAQVGMSVFSGKEVVCVEKPSQPVAVVESSGTAHVMLSHGGEW